MRAGRWPPRSTGTLRMGAHAYRKTSTLGTPQPLHKPFASCVRSRVPLGNAERRLVGVMDGPESVILARAELQRQAAVAQRDVSGRRTAVSCTDALWLAPVGSTVQHHRRRWSFAGVEERQTPFR